MAPSVTPNVNDEEAAEDSYGMDDAMEAIKPGDIVIAVMGVTGVGKSTFISLFNQEARVGQDLQSETSQIGTHPATVGGKKIFLIDTPGFDDTHISDIEVLRRLADWLNRTHQNNIRLAGVVYLHRIGDTRLGGSAMKNLRMFRKLCGDNALSSVVLATTMWGMVPEDIAERREAQLKTNPEFWAGMISKGSKVFRQDQGLESATEIINYIVGRRRATSLDIQREMADGKNLDETAAGLEVEAEKEKMRAKHREELIQLQKEAKEAQEARDVEAQKELAALKADLEAKMKKEQDERERMRVSMEELQKQRDQEVYRERDAAHVREMQMMRELMQERAKLEKNMAVGDMQAQLRHAKLQVRLANAQKKAEKLRKSNLRLQKRLKRR